LSRPASTSSPERDDIAGDQLPHAPAAQHRLRDQGRIGPVLTVLDEELETLGLHVFPIGYAWANHEFLVVAHLSKETCALTPATHRPPVHSGRLPFVRMPNGSARILLVDDEHSIQTLLSYPLRKDGYHVTGAHDGSEALERFDEARFDLVILDLMLPKLDGVEVCRQLRSRSQVPIIMLTAKGSETDKVAGLEVGADDYITKPFSMREFRSRVKAALRRSRMIGDAPEEESIERGDLKIDFGRRVVALRGEEVRLTYVEFEILGALARSPGRVLSRETLLEHVWGDSEYRDPRTVDVHIRHLREKLESEPKKPEFLFTVRGVGYRFNE
jgi:DNA-binding response OmpR family regulator